MEIFRDETEFTDIHMVQRVVDLFENRSGFQRIVRLGLIANMNYDNDSDEDGYRADSWAHDRNHIRGYPGLSDSRDRGLGGNHTRPHSVCVPPMHYYTSSCEVPSPSSVKVTTKESDSERKARLLEEEKKSKEKAERKRLKKQNRKERKRLEKLEKEKQNPKRYTEEKDDAQQSKAEESKPANDESKNNTGVSVKQLASAKDIDSSDSSEDESSDEDSVTKNDLGDCEEELDMTSTFVSKAALIAKRKLEKKPKPEKREKKKTPVKEEPKTVPDKLNEVPEVEKQASAASVTHSHEENIKISTDLAVIGNKFASAGDFNMAVKYFTDAIKYNPTEFKLFGNRSFCFEKMQEYEKALTDAELSLSMWPGWVKGLFRKGRALAGLKRYEEAARAFKEVLKLDTSCAEAAQELMRVQITQLMEYGFTREQSSNALIIHGTVEKALEVLTKLNHRPGAFQNGPLQPAQVVNVSGVSPVLSANTVPAPHPPPQSMNAPKTAFKNKPLGPVHNMSNVQSQPKPVSNQAMKTNSEDSHPPQELFPVWVGNLTHPVTESMITNVFNKVGVVYSVKLLIYRRCAFVNFTKQEHCDEAIRRLHGYELNGMKIAVRYPDRIPPGMGISRSALKAEDLQDENMRQNDYAGGRRPVHPHRHVPDFRGNHKY
ncbi:tetratricopeptide repeat protein 31-like isoform X2 [Plectropomus leopardus]|uniref:tetratricopeptide repeat protein 31-like isoform X2 n=1 Tax=Plectropomus leopardus TaxID=160734 RepID=UPI001C4D3FF1|nr:tetratricopeptide repeat protein 31-like isoform X2 [Plectropomus leopardus]